jgi:hypothetical protein
MTISLNRNWVNTLTVSLPEYANELGKQIEVAMTEQVLDDIDAHACALGAAIATGNGELAFEIAMSDTLRGTEIREDIAKTVIDLMIDNSDVVDNPTLYTLAIAHVLNIRVSDITNNLSAAGVEEYKLDAVKRIARLIPAIGKCVI